jgi:DNA-binding LytR/AlgR family response regulator
MKKVCCLIVDDEPMARALIAGYVEKTPFLELAGQCANALEIPELLKNRHIDVLLMDIEMPELNGLDFLKSWSVKPKVICITAHRHYAVQAFDVQVIDYVLKPVSYERFLKAVQRYIERSELSSQTSELFIPVDREMRKVPFSDILYIEAMGDYLKFFIQKLSKPLITKMTLGAALEKLDNGFLQIHRSFIVNKSQIVAYTADRIKVEEKWLTIGRSYKDMVKTSLG